MSLLAALAPEALAELEALIDARVEQCLAKCIPAPTPPSPLLTVDEAGAYIRAKPQRIRDLLYQRRLTAIKDGTRTLIVRAELDAYLNNERN